MEHQDAVRLRATERYLLGELHEPERDEFEEHYFSCPLCAEDVRAGQLFAANTRAALRREGRAMPAKWWEKWIPARLGFPLSAALNAILLLVVGYQTARVVPALRQELSAANAPQFVPDIELRGIARSASEVLEIPAGAKRVVLTVNLPDPVSYLTYEFRDDRGNVPMRGRTTTPPIDESHEVHLAISLTGLPPGEYEVLLRGRVNATEEPVGRRRVLMRG